MKIFVISVRLTIVLMVLCSGLYSVVVWGIGRAAFPWRSEGSLVVRNGRVAGSALIGQEFTSPRYFQGRPSAVGYNAAGSGGSNMGPTNPALLARFSDATTSAVLLGDQVTTGTVAFDSVSASGSGLDPDITPANAGQQAARVAKTRGMATEAVQQLIREHTRAPLLGCLGPARVNVLALNLALDSASAPMKSVIGK